MKKLMWYVLHIDDNNKSDTRIQPYVTCVYILKSGLAFIILPTLTGQPAFGLAERELSSSTCLGRLDVIAPTIHLFFFVLSPSCVAAPLIDHLLRQFTFCSFDIYQQMLQCMY